MTNFTLTIASALDGLEAEELEYATIDVIRQHRASIDNAERVYERWLATDDETKKEAFHLRYADALRITSVQIALITALTDKLGFIPSVPGKNASMQ